MADVVVPEAVVTPARTEAAGVLVHLILADVVLYQVQRASLLNVHALVAVRAEGVVVDPVLLAHVRIDVVRRASPELDFRRLFDLIKMQTHF